MSPVDAGRKLFQVQGCAQCHSVDGSARIGPTLHSGFGTSHVLADGEHVLADENYLRRSILEPAADVVAGFEPVMPTYQGRLSEGELTALVEYLKSLSPSAVPASEGE